MYQNPYDQFDDQSQNGFQLSPPDPRRPAQIRQTQNQADASVYDPARAAAELARTRQQIGSQPLQNEATQQSIVNNRQQYRNSAVDQERQLSTEFQKRPEVSSFFTIAPQYASALRAAKVDNKAADHDLINAYAKILDPASVVREGEVASAGNVGGVSEQVQGYFSALSGQGRLTPAQRQEIIGQIRNRASSAADLYRQSREQYGKLASQYGYDPERVVGANPAQPFQQLEADYFGHPIKNGNSFVQPGNLVHPGAPNGGQSGPNSPLDPEGVGDIGFNQSAQGLPPQAQEAQKDIQDAIASGKLRTVDQIVSYSKDRWNFDADPKRVAQALESIAKGGSFSVATPQFKTDISDMRGTKAADLRLGMQQQMASGIPIAGPLIQGMGQILGPQKADALARGVVDVPSLGLSEEIMSGFDQQSLARQNAIRDYDKQNNLGARFSGQMLGGLAIPSGVMNEARSAGTTAMREGLGRAGALRAAGSAGAVRAGQEGAAIGGAYGFGSTDGNMLDRTGGAAIGGATGALGGFTLGRVSGMLGARTRAAGAAQRNAAGTAANAERAGQIEAAQAAAALGIDMPRFVAGGRTAQGLGAFADQTPLGSAVIGRAQDTMIDQSRAARNAIAGAAGQVMEPNQMGERVATGVMTANNAARQNVRNLYTRAENLAGDTMAAPQNVMQTLSGLLREEAQVPGGTPVQAILQRYATDFEARGAMTIQGARKMRTTLRSTLRDEGGLSSSDADRITHTIMDSVGQDIETALVRSGRQAAVPAYRAADQAHAQRLEMVDDVLKRYVGKNNDATGEQVASAIMTDAKGGGSRLHRLINYLPEDDANAARATIANQLGRSTSGTQNSQGTAFSLDTFLTNWDQIRGARERIFSRDTVRDLNRLAAVAERAKAAGRSANHSNTGRITAAIATASPAFAGVNTLMSGGSPAVAAAGVLSTVAASITQYGGARLLASPGFARRLAQTVENPRASSRFWSDESVAQLVRASPTLAPEITGFRTNLLKAMNDNLHLGAAAAADDKERRRRGY